MKKYSIIVFLIFLIGLIGFAACEEFLEETPKTLVTETNFFGETASEAGIEQFINGIYPGNWWTMNDRRWSWFATVPADEFNHTLSYDVEGQEYDNHDFNASQFNLFRQWDYIWWPIARANTFFFYYDDLVENYGDKWTKLENFKGQALFFRARNFFLGLEMYGPIPLVTEAPSGENFPNSTVPELYNQTIADLQEIVDNNYLPKWTALAAEDKGRITSGAAKSLLAKVYLSRSYNAAAQSGDVDKAVQYAKDVIDNEGYDLFTEPILAENGIDTLYTAYEVAFLPESKNGKEGIWEYQFYPGVSGSGVNNVFLLSGYGGTWGDDRLRATELLYNSFEPGDLRKKSYIYGDVISPYSGDTISTNGFIYMKKFWDPDLNNGRGRFANNWPFIRFADVLLIYAEALNKQNNGPTAEALTAINRVRSRAGLPDLTGPGTFTYETFLKAIQDERFHELAGEGHRLRDLRRWGFATLKERVEMSNPNASVEPHEVLYPIPSEELSQNPLMVQNNGYN